MRNYVYLVLTALILGSSFIVVKDTLTAIDPFALIALEFLIASLSLFIVILIKKLDLRKHLGIGIATGIIQFLIYATQTVGLQYTTPSNSAFITGTFVIFTPFISYLFTRSPIKINHIVAATLALAGVWILTGGVQEMNIGDLITFITAVCVALLFVLTASALRKGADVIVISFNQLAVTTLLSFIAAVLLGNSFQLNNSDLYMPILYLGIFSLFIAYLLQNTALGKVNPTAASVILSLEPFFAIISSWIFGFENFSLVKLGGGMLIILACIASEITLKKRTEEKAGPD